MNYRKDIDGLRSIAVLLVVFHHAGMEWLSGGYVGVDVFFVISGYLITTIVYKDAVDGQFSFSSFYIRRIRRLMPALYSVLLATSVLSILLLAPSDLIKYGKSLVYVFFYAGNFFFWTEYGGYFAGNTQEAPLLHTWSLAVEEQYYLVWPLYILIGLRLFNTKVFGVVTLFGFIFSVFFSEWATRNTIGAAYYLLPTRFFELLLGSLLAIYWSRIPELGKLLNDILSLIGISLIIGSSIYLSPSSAFPGFNAIYPVLGSALIILTNKNSVGIVNRILSLRPFVFFGLISYSLYLWHWPIFVFVRYSAVELTFSVQISCVMLAVVAAFISWKFIEMPFRKRSYSSIWSASNSLLIKPGVIAGLVFLVIFMGNGIPQRFSNNILAMDSALNSQSHIERSACHSSSRFYAEIPNQNCRLGDIEIQNEVSGLLIGDSHANHLVGFVESLALDAQRLVIDYTMDQCPPIFGLAWGRTATVAGYCLERNVLTKSFIDQNDFDFVILSASWPYLGSTRAYINGNRVESQSRRADLIQSSLHETIDYLTAKGITPILFDDVSSLINIDPKCPIKKVMFKQDLVCKTEQTINPFMDRIFAQLERDFPSLIRINLNEIICEDEYCTLELDGIPLFLDDNHLNLIGSRHLGKKFLLENDNPFVQASGL